MSRSDGDQLDRNKPAVPAEQLIKLRVEADVVLVDVRVELFRAENLGDLHQLVIVVVPMEERLLAEDL